MEFNELVVTISLRLTLAAAVLDVVAAVVAKVVSVHHVVP
jgi:hypothetical protein